MWVSYIHCHQNHVYKVPCLCLSISAIEEADVSSIDNFVKLASNVSKSSSRGVVLVSIAVVEIGTGHIEHDGCWNPCTLD